MKSRVICDAKNRRLWILGNIKSRGLKNKAVNFLKKLDIISLQPIMIIISSGGGTFYYCLEIYQTIRNLKSISVTIGSKMVQSGAFLIHQGGDARQATRSTYFKFHRGVMLKEGVLKELREGEFNKERLRQFVESLEIMDAIQLMAFTLRGRPVSQIISLFNHGAAFSAYAAKKLNLVDKVVLERNVPRPPLKAYK